MQFVCGDRASEPETTGDLIIKNCTEEDFLQIWKPYLDLDRDYGEIKRTLTADDLVMGEAVACGQGIRILKQDLWETIVSFIISQNNNIPRIKGCIENLSLIHILLPDYMRVTEAEQKLKDGSLARERAAKMARFKAR